MNKNQTPGYVLAIITVVAIVATCLVAFTTGEIVTHRDILNVVLIIGLALMMTIGYFVMFLWDNLNRMALLYELLTGDDGQPTEEFAGVLQRIRNTLTQAGSNIHRGGG